MEQSVGRRIVPVSGGGVYDKPLRFVDDKDRFILVEDRKIDLLRSEPVKDRQGVFDADFIPGLNGIPFLRRFAVQPKRSVGDNCSGKLFILRSKIEIEPLLSFKVRHVKRGGFRDLRHYCFSPSAQSAIETPKERVPAIAAWVRKSFIALV